MATDTPRDTDADADAAGTDDVPTVELTTTDGVVRFAVPDDATEDEAAALVACLGAYVNDHHRAAAAASGDDGPREVDRWAIAGRYGCRCRADLPRGGVERGSEWKMAGRARSYR